MVIRIDLEQAVSRYCRETLQRLGLADAVLSLWAHVMEATTLRFE